MRSLTYIDIYANILLVNCSFFKLKKQKQRIMKRTFFGVIATLTLTFALAQSSQTFSNAEIATIITQSKEYNEAAGVVNPHMIQPGQVLTYQFFDETEHQIVVEEGDNQWGIVRDKLSDLVAIHGSIVDPEPKKEVDGSTETASTVPVPVTSLWLSRNWFWLLLGAMSTLVAYFLIRRHEKEKAEAAQNPITSGPAMREGGVNNEGAYAYAQEVARRQFNTPNITVRDVVRGTLSGTNLEVFYAGQSTPQRRTFSNQPAYRGTVDVNGIDQYVYFLQGCANDVRAGNYFQGQNIIFVADVAQPAELQPRADQSAMQTVAQSDRTPVFLTSMIAASAEIMKDKETGFLEFTMPDGISLKLGFTGTVKAAPKTDKASLNGIASEIEKVAAAEA